MTHDSEIQIANQSAPRCPNLSIILPTKNRYPTLLEALQSISVQTVLPCEIIIVDQTPDQGSWPEILAKAVPASVRLKHLWRPAVSGLTEARNLAIENADGDILLFLDDDVTLHRDFLERLVASWKVHPEATGISGVPDNYSPPKGFYNVWAAIFMRGPFHDDRQPVYWHAASLTKPVQVTRFSGGMMSMRKSAMKGVRFDNHLRGVADGEDVDFCVRLKGIYFIDPQCKLTHHFDTSGRERSHWTQRHARANAYLYNRDWRRHRLAYAWLRVGYFVAAILGCASRKSVDPLRAMLAGISEGERASQPGC